MTACPDTGALRALLDDEAPAHAVEHARSCRRCDEELDSLRGNAAFAQAALALLDPAGPTAQSTSVSNGSASASPTPDGFDGAEVVPLRRSRRRQVFQRVAAAAVVVTVAAGVVGTPAGRQAAASFLEQFRSERLTVLEIDPQLGFGPFMVLGSLGTLEGAEELGVVEGLPDVDTAEQRLGAPLPVPDPDALPDGFPREPQVLFSEATQVRLDFDQASVERWISEHGGGPEIPAGLSETTLVVAIPAAALLSYESTGIERLVVGQSGLLTAETEGPVGLAEVRAFLLELPGLPAGLVSQLAAIDDWRSTLPLPIPAEMVEWRDITIDGTPAVALEGTGGLGSAVLWQRDGWVRGVGGLVDEDTALRLATDLLR